MFARRGRKGLLSMRPYPISSLMRGLANLAGLPEERLTFVQGDVCDAQLANSLIIEANVIVHFAAESHHDNSIVGPLPFLRFNIEGIFTILEAARKYGVRFHHVSTDEVYGDLELEDLGSSASEIS